MKKISSMLALGMAFALTFGMTVSAAGSPTTQDPNLQLTETQVNNAAADIKKMPSVTGSTATDAKGNAVTLTVSTVKPETVAELKETKVTEQVVDALKTAGTAESTVAKAVTAAKLSTEDGKKVDPDSIKIGKTPVAAAVLTIPEGTQIPESGLRVEINLPDFKPAAGKAYVVMHLGKNGWEVIAPDAISEGKVVATFKDLSPVTLNEISFALVPVENEKDEGNSEDDTQQAAAAPAAANPAVSPKTAETFPMAGVVTLIALAGAAVCAGRLRSLK